MSREKIANISLFWGVAAVTGSLLGITDAAAQQGDGTEFAQLLAARPVAVRTVDPGDDLEIDDELEAADDELEAADDELDSLLDLADKDVGALSSVNVRRAAMAPALNTEVTTVNRQKSTVGRSPAAIFVVSNEMIRRSGARTIPDVLRMVPGVQVARVDGSKWAVSIRGLNGRFANKLLVQIDGRTVYTPVFGGTFWDVQDVLFEDVDRIEVSRGPGAAVWGANAVNGVINVITKDASETRGAFVEAGGGTQEAAFTNGRLGWRTAGGVDTRVYGKWFERDSATSPGRAAHDDWRIGRGGFRSDYQPDESSHLTVQGDYYSGETGSESIVPTTAPPLEQSVVDDAPISGWNGLIRYSQTIADDNQWTVQAYFDKTDRELRQFGFREVRDTVDVDFQHHFRAGNWHSVVWGASYRNSEDRVQNSPPWLTFTPASRAIDEFNYFIQDEMTLVDDSLYFTVGSKFSHTDYAPFEWQPTARLLWTPDHRRSLWASYSRAVRTPTRVEHDGSLLTRQDPSAPGAFPLVSGSRDFTSENLDAWEFGMRSQPTKDFSWDLACFYFDYDDSQALMPGAPFFDPGVGAVVVPLSPDNSGEGYSYGAELAMNYRISRAWRLYGAYSYLNENFAATETNFENSPRNQIYTQASWDPCRHWSVDTIWRYVDSLPSGGVSHYNAMDVRIAWRPNRHTEMAVVGRNLLDRDHPEFASDGFTGNIATNVRREVFGTFSLRF